MAEESQKPAKRKAAKKGASATTQAASAKGKPCIKGTRITVYDILEYLASGMSEDEILADFPYPTRDDIRACIAFAADRERKLVSIPPAA